MKLVANLVLCALAFAAVTDASSFRRAEACDGGDPEPTPAPTTIPPVTPVVPVTTAPTPVTTAPVSTSPSTTAPATTAPATTAPVTTAPATTAPVTTAPATTAPVTTAPATTAPVTTAPATTAPVTTAPATTAPVTTAPATTAPVTTAPATTAPVTTAPATTAPATTAPATTAPATTAPATTAPATTTPATTAPAPAWDLTTPYDRSGVDCFGLLRIELKASDTLLKTNCVSDFSFFNGVEVVEGCVVCPGTYDASLTLAPFPLCNNKPICGRIGDYTDLTQGEVDCVIKANGSKSALDACKLGSNAVTPAPTTAAPTPSTPAPVTTEPVTTAPTPTYPVTSAPVPTPPSSYNMDTPYDSYGLDCFGNTRIQLSASAAFSTANCVKDFTYFNGQIPVKACLVCPGTYDESSAPALCSGKPICGRIGDYLGLTQTELKCVVDANGSPDVVSTCTLADNF